MAGERDRFQKVLALAVNPGAVDAEATAAFQKLRELVRLKPDLAHPASTPEPPPAPPSPPALQPTDILRSKITLLEGPWLLILISMISGSAHKASLRYAIHFDFSEVPPALLFTCEGSEGACAYMGNMIKWAVDYVNKQKVKFPF